MQPQLTNEEIAGKGITLFLILLVIIIAFSNLLSGCDLFDDPDPAEPEFDIKGYWEAVEINTPMGAGFENTTINIFNTTYTFNSETIIGYVDQDGSYTLEGDLLRIELSFPIDPLILIGKAGNTFKVSVKNESMVWQDINSNNNLIWKNGKGILENEGDRKSPPLNPLPEPPIVF